MYSFPGATTINNYKLSGLKAAEMDPLIVLEAVIPKSSLAGPHSLQRPQESIYSGLFQLLVVPEFPGFIAAGL